MWNTPIYKFKTQVENKEKEIFIDVTCSAPNFKVPGIQLEGTFKSLLHGLEPSKTKILDFGGAKLRNTIYLLKKGYTVYSCEFEDLFKRSKQANDFLEEAKKFPNFKQLVFPYDFINFNEKFDVILLINVLNIMPVPIERLCVLALCREKMSETGRLLWYTQHGAYSEDKAVAKLYDGLVTGQGREFNMFYRDFTRKEIHDMLQSTGFTFNNDFKFPTSGTNQAYVFNPVGPILVDKTLGLIAQLKKTTSKRLKEVERKSGNEEKVYTAEVPTRKTELKSVDFLKQYVEELDKTRTGRANATKYHRLVFNILKLVLEDRLRKAKIEESLFNGTQRGDITFQNCRCRGFFKQLDEGYHITCPNIFMECKNYDGDIGNPAFSQIQNRLNKIRGQFGIIICRKIVNKTKAKERQDTLRKDDKYVLVFEDTDIKKLVNLKLNSDEDGVDDFIEEKFKVLV